MPPSVDRYLLIFVMYIFKPQTLHITRFSREELFIHFAHRYDQSLYCKLYKLYGVKLYGPHNATAMDGLTELDIRPKMATHSFLWRLLGWHRIQKSFWLPCLRLHYATHYFILLLFSSPSFINFYALLWL